MRAKCILGGFALMLSVIFLTLGCAKKHSNSSGSSDSNFSVTEVAQTAGSDGHTGSFVIPENGISFLLSIFLDNNNSVKFKSLTDPDGTDILNNSSTPNLYLDASGSSGNEDEDAAKGYANVLVPQSPSFSAKAGKWTFTAYNNNRVKLALRKGTAPSGATIAVQPFITGTAWDAGDISDALSVMSGIYLKNGITLTLKSTITITETEYSEVSRFFTNTTTSALIKKGSSDSVNIFFIEDYSYHNLLGNAAGMPGSMGDVNSWNGVLVSLTAHAEVTALDAQLLGETAAHEMGHQLGLFHTTEDKGTIFDILSDTPECSRSSKDNDSSGTVTAEECDGFGGDNLMFWRPWSSVSRSAGKKQETLSSQQQHVLKYSPMAK